MPLEDPTKEETGTAQPEIDQVSQAKETLKRDRARARKAKPKPPLKPEKTDAEKKKEYAAMIREQN